MKVNSSHLFTRSAVIVLIVSLILTIPVFTGKSTVEAASTIFTDDADIVTITLNGNGGMGEFSSTSYISGTNTAYNKIVPPIDWFQRPGYKPVGWNTKADGTGLSVDAGREWNELATSGDLDQLVGQDGFTLYNNMGEGKYKAFYLTLYAQWEKFISIYKKWDDNNNAEGKRPDSITVDIIGVDRLDYQYNLGSVTLTAADDWKIGTFVPEYFEGKRIEKYIISEGDVEQYTTTVNENKINQETTAPSDVEETNASYIVINELTTPSKDPEPEPAKTEPEPTKTQPTPTEGENTKHGANEKGKSSKSSAPRIVRTVTTGDNMQLMTVIVLLILSSGAVAVAAIRRNFRQKS